MRYSGLSFLDKFCDLKIFEYPTSYILTTFKIGTRALSDTTHLIHDYNLILDESDLLFNRLNRDKKIYIVIKNPVDRFLSGATQLTFEGATKYTAAYSLAKWGTESHFFTNFWPELINLNITNVKQIYSYDFNVENFKGVDENVSAWKTWLDIIHFNLKMGDNHLSQYHQYCYQNCYKVLNHDYDITIIQDTDLKNNETFKSITDMDLPKWTYKNTKWVNFLKTEFIYDIDDTLPHISLNPAIISEQAVEIENYLSEEYEYYNKFKTLL